MSAQPQRQSSATPEPAPQTDMLVDALMNEAQAQAARRESQERVQFAINRHARVTDFTWQLNDDRDAELRVYFNDDDELQILAAELIRVDYRKPTAQERARIEAEFFDEMEAASDLWLSVSRYIVNG